MAYGTVNADVIGTSVVGSNLGAGNASIMKNRIINGAMVISQYNGTSSVTPTAAAYTLDRWQAIITQASKFSVQQNAGSVTPPAGFKNYLGVTSLAATSLGATDYYTISQKIEGFNTADLAWGSADAKTVTVSFWVRSSLTGTFGFVLRNAAGNRVYPASYTISSANTWEQKSVTIAGDTTGTWATDNTIGIELDFGLGVGSTYSNTAGTWTTGGIGTTGAVSVVGTNAATWYLTGVQLEVGSSATGFEYRQYQQELALCQRYYWLYQNGGLGSTATAAIVGNGIVRMPVTMRTQPTLSASATFTPQTGSAGTASVYTGTGAGNGNDGLFIYNSASNWAVGIAVQINNAGFSAEL
jgi:hypothetical protein